MNFVEIQFRFYMPTAEAVSAIIMLFNGLFQAIFYTKKCWLIRQKCLENEWILQVARIAWNNPIIIRVIAKLFCTCLLILSFSSFHSAPAWMTFYERNGNRETIVIVKLKQGVSIHKIVQLIFCIICIIWLIWGENGHWIGPEWILKINCTHISNWRQK